MISINLIPYREARRQRLLQMIIIGWIFSALVGVLITFWVDIIYQEKEKNLAITQIKNDLIIKNYDKKLGEIKEIADRKALILARLDIINTLGQERTLPVHIFDELTQLIPELVWLTQVKTKEKQLTLTGLAMSNSLVADFMKRLSRSPYFSKIALTKVSQVVERGDKIKSFTLKLGFALPKPPDTNPKGNKKKSNSKKQSGPKKPPKPSKGA